MKTAFLFPVEEIARIVKEIQTKRSRDGINAVGKIPID